MVRVRLASGYPDHAGRAIIACLRDGTVAMELIDWGSPEDAAEADAVLYKEPCSRDCVGRHLRNTATNRTEWRIMKVKRDTMSLISAAIAVAIWVVVIRTAIAAIVAHIWSLTQDASAIADGSPA